MGMVYNNGIIAGYLQKTEMGKFIFRYEVQYFMDKSAPPISLTLPKTQQEYHSEKLFPFFFGLLAEGVNKEIQCRLYKIDENDDFARLLATTNEDTIGSITIKTHEI